MKTFVSFYVVLTSLAAAPILGADDAEAISISMDIARSGKVPEEHISLLDYLAMFGDSLWKTGCHHTSESSRALHEYGDATTSRSLGGWRHHHWSWSKPWTHKPAPKPSKPVHKPSKPVHKPSKPSKPANRSGGKKGSRDGKKGGHDSRKGGFGGKKGGYHYGRHRTLAAPTQAAAESVSAAADGTKSPPESLAEGEEEEQIMEYPWSSDEDGNYDIDDDYDVDKDCFKPLKPQVVLPFTQALPTKTTVSPPGAEHQVGTVYIFNGELFNTTSLSTNLATIHGSSAKGHCVKLQTALDNELPGSGYCHFTYTLTMANGATVHLNAVGEVTDGEGGTLSVTGGTGSLVGAAGEVALIPSYKDNDVKDFFVDAQYYLASVVLFVD